MADYGGFMSGFGASFAKSYEAENDRRAAREQDEFRYAFEAALKRKDEKTAHEKKVAAQTSQAESIVTHGGLPPEALGDVYKLVGDGWTNDDIIATIKNGKFAPAPEAPAAQKAQSVEDQTNTALPVQPGDASTLPDTVGGGTPPAAPAATAGVPSVTTPGSPEVPDAAASPAPSATSADQNPLDPRHPVADDQVADAGPNPADMVNPRVRKRVEGLTGEPLDLSPVDETPPLKPSGRFIPGPPAFDWITEAEAIDKVKEAKAKGDEAGAARYQQVVDSHNEAANRKAMAENPGDTMYAQWHNADGSVETKAIYRDPEDPNKWVRADQGELPEKYRPIGKVEQERRENITKKDPEAVKFRGRQAKGVSLLADGADIIKMVEEDEHVITGVGDMAGVISNLSDEAKAAIDILNMQDETPEQAESAFRDIEAETNRIDDILKSGGVLSLGEKTQLLDAKIALMSYRAGDVENQRGPSFTEKDYNRMYKVITANTSDPETFKKAVTQYMKNVRSNLKQEGKQFNEGMTEFKDYESDFGPGSAPTAGIVEDFDEVVKKSGNEAAMASLERMTKAQHEAPKPPEMTEEEEMDVMPIEEATPILLQDPTPENKKWFDTTYGIGAADKAIKASRGGVQK